LLVVPASGLAVYVAATHRRRPARFALGVGAVLLAGGLSEGIEGRVLLRERNFFGVVRVTDVPEGSFHRLWHGRTLHGQQSFAPGREREPLTYFSRSGPVGQVFEAFHAGEARRRVGVLGLGTGSLATYAEPGERWTYYEIDPAVVRIAADPRYFTYLRDCRADSLDVVRGDARVRLREAPEGGFGLLIFDAFSSDSIPMHLLTREALRLYRRKLADGGLIVLNISNRYLDLDPVVGTLARDAGLACRIRLDNNLSPAEKRAGKSASMWAVLAARESDLGPLTRDPRWSEPRPDPGAAPWTDDYADILGHLSFFRRSRISQAHR
jgi:SAM-dependent methyltransferase